MLTQLYINNVAVISEATIELTRGLNVFTGETGAGKTILIHAINAVLGERTSKDIIRTGEERAVISALFTELSEPVQKALEEAGFSVEEESVLISREISGDGKSACKINGRPATVTILKMISSMLIHLHGQHDNQQLLSPQKHLGFIDSFGELYPAVGEYREVYRAYQETKQELAEIDTDEAQKAHRMDLLNYQINEITDAELTEGEEEALKAQRKLIKNALHITQALGGSVAILDGDTESGSLTALLGALSEQMDTAAQYMDQAQPIAERLTELLYEVEGISGDIRALLEDFDCDASELDAIERRLDLIYTLKKKYGADIAEILRFRANAIAELEGLETSDVRARQLKELLECMWEKVVSLADSLSKQRRLAADRFVAAVQEELVFLDMPSVRLSVRQKEKTPGIDGKDELELLIVTNIGEQAKSLAKTASGGELSRIMLSIKNVIADRDAIDTMIFDEVDTGVSGRAAQKIGQKLAQVAQNRQVIVVTHLAQVASYAKQHLYISKQTKEDRTFTTIAVLDRPQRIYELARIGGGEKISALALEHAQEMLKEAGN